MKKQITNRVVAAITMASMVMSATACGGSAEPATQTEEKQEEVTQEQPAAETTETEPAAETEAEAVEEEEDVSPYTILNDPATGAPYDLGGMEVIVRNWWSPEDGSTTDPETQFEEDNLAYHEWLEETYNFTFKYMGGLGWGQGITDEFQKYCTSGGDDQALLFTLPDGFQGPSILQGLAYDWATIDTIDLNDSKYTKNAITGYDTIGDKTYGVLAGDPEIGAGLYFNHRILEECGIDPNSIYDMVDGGTWTWDAFEDMLKTVAAVDKDGDGQSDYFALGSNGIGQTMTVAVLGNGGDIIGKDADGHFVNKAEEAASLEAIEFAYRITKDYYMTWHDPAVWDDYRTNYTDGKIAFLIEDGYAGQAGSFVGSCADENGFVPFPTKDGKNLISTVHGNIIMMPGCYSPEKARLIAFAYDAWETLPAGYEDYNSRASEFNKYNFDEKGIQTNFDLQDISKIKVTYAGWIPELEVSSPLDGATWDNVFFAMFNGTATVSEIMDKVRDKWAGILDDTNAALDAI